MYDWNGKSESTGHKYLGLIFDLQGQSMVGPKSSFMYANPDWITYGIQIMIGGIIIIGIGSVLKILKK